MGGLVRRLIIGTIRRGVSFVLLVPSLVRVHTPFRTRIYRLANFAERPSADYAVVAIHPGKRLSKSLRNLMAGLAHNQVNVVLVCNGTLDPADRELMSGQVATLIERENLGRDFGAYQAGLLHLETTGKLASCRKLLLVNDSVFYAGSIDRLIAEVLGHTAPVVGLFEIFEHHYHVSSFFLCFSQAVVSHCEFRRYWTRYKPYSTRHHVIFEGEGRLSALLMRLSFTPHIIYSTSVAHAALSAAAGKDPAKGLADITMLLPEPWVVPLLSRYTALPLPGRNGAPPTDIEQAETPALSAHLIAAFIREAENVNQSHGLALCANRLLGAPVIKRDICFRGFWSIGTLLQRVQGYDEDERAEMLLELRRKGKSPSRLGLERLRFLIDA